LTYTKQLAESCCAPSLLYSLETGKSQSGDGWDERCALPGSLISSGKYLYFTASTNLGPSDQLRRSVGHSEISPTRSVYLASCLRNDIPSPLAPESDEEKVAEEKKPGLTTKRTPAQTG
jgi:tricorn protease